MKKLWRKIADWFVFNVGRIRWTQEKRLAAEELDEIRRLLADDYYFIMTRRHNWISAYLTYIAHFFLTGRFGEWSHVLMNMENEVDSDDDFLLVEAIQEGVTLSSFSDVFGKVDGVALLKPKGLTLEQWTAAFDEARTHLGKQYDTLFDLKDETRMSCVELVRTVMRRADPNYDENFAGLESLISKHRNLTPQMFVDCGDFEVVYYVRR